MERAREGCGSKRFVRGRVRGVDMRCDGGGAHECGQLARAEAEAEVRACADWCVAWGLVRRDVGGGGRCDVQREIGSLSSRLVCIYTNLEFQDVKLMGKPEVTHS